MAYKSQYSPAFLLNAQHTKWIPFEEREEAVSAGEFNLHNQPQQRICLDGYTVEVEPNAFIPLPRLFPAVNSSFQQVICQFIAHVKGIPFAIKAY